MKTKEVDKLFLWTVVQSMTERQDCDLVVTKFMAT